MTNIIIGTQHRTQAATVVVETNNLDNMSSHDLSLNPKSVSNNLMPRVLGGSSAGSIVCGIVGTRTDEECFRDLFFNMRGTDAPGHSGDLSTNFFRPLHIPLKGALPHAIGEVVNNSAGAFYDAKRTWQIFVPIPLRGLTSVIFDLFTFKTRPAELLMNDSEHFRECLRKDIGDFTFQEAFDRTGRILNITVTPKNSSDPPRLLNYLTAPHVLVWSAAVASSSLPGVFEANRLMVKDADGTVRYESAERATFSDGSMEADLPMQQLSEMFNINHFIISQANPHAVMFASYNHFRSVWANPVSGFVNAVLSFLKGRCRTWLAHAVEIIGATRIAPSHATSRGIGSQFFVQEYEGRDCDISLIPWLNHRSLSSAFMHCLYNPDKDEVMEWINAAERETWKHIPAIKSHIAEEVTLDRCVQRLRKRLAAESWEKSRVDSTGQKMGERVPSFFRSPSLVNLGGLGISDQSKIGGIENNEMHTAEATSILSLDINQGWGGQGLRGNRSTASLNRSSSAGSGLFLEGDELSTNPSVGQAAGEQTNPSLNKSKPSSTDSRVPEFNRCMKTTTMAQFYYRNFHRYDKFPRSFSHHDQLDENGNKGHHRRKSQSHNHLSGLFNQAVVG